MGLLGSHLVVLGGGARGSTKETIRTPPWGPQERPYVVVSMMAECGRTGGPAVPPGRGQPRRAPRDPGPHVRSLGGFLSSRAPAAEREDLGAFWSPAAFVLDWGSERGTALGL